MKTSLALLPLLVLLLGWHPTTASRQNPRCSKLTNYYFKKCVNGKPSFYCKLVKKGLERYGCKPLCNTDHKEECVDKGDSCPDNGNACPYYYKCCPIVDTTTSTSTTTVTPTTSTTTETPTTSTTTETPTTSTTTETSTTSTTTETPTTSTTTETPTTSTTTETPTTSTTTETPTTSTTTETPTTTETSTTTPTQSTTTTTGTTTSTTITTTTTKKTTYKPETCSRRGKNYVCRYKSKGCEYGRAVYHETCPYDKVCCYEKCDSSYGYSCIPMAGNCQKKRYSYSSYRPCYETRLCCVSGYRRYTKPRAKDCCFIKKPKSRYEAYTFQKMYRSGRTVKIRPVYYH